jgi:hypothetical protein
MQRRTASRIWIYDKRIAAQSINGPQQVAPWGQYAVAESCKYIPGCFLNRPVHYTNMSSDRESWMN